MICDSTFIKVYNETFKFIHGVVPDGLGADTVVDYWKRIAPAILADLKEMVEVDGLCGANNYWTKILTAEDAVFGTTLVSDNWDNEKGKELILEIYECPSLKILGDNVYENYCQHCIVMYAPIFEEKGYDYKVERKDRGCRIRITRKKSASLATEATPAPA